MLINVLNEKDYVIFPDEQFPKIDWVGNILELYLGSEDYMRNLFNLRGVENPNKLCDIVTNKVFSYKKPKDDRPR
ncbi:MAG: hypothetical protein KJ905_00460 [Nanoarchaeota archaeon]|nr:hypothetical protein [Nanoarchaeota archaeon]MBU1501232.1 hypothetical protein [Nanoarchaeota archaeon]